MRGGVVLPESAEVADLPAADGLGGLFVTGVWGEVAGDGPAADAGAVGLEIEAAEQLAGDGAVGRARRGAEQAGGQSERLRRPVWMMVAPRTPRRPGVGLPLRAGAKIIGAKLVKTSQPQTEIGGQSCGTKLARPPPGKEMTEQWRGKTTGELRVFITPPVAGGWILRILADAGHG